MLDAKYEEPKTARVDGVDESRQVRWYGENEGCESPPIAATDSEAVYSLRIIKLRISLKRCVSQYTTTTKRRSPEARRTSLS